MSLVLCGDIGGTRTRLALVEVAAGKARVVSSTVFPSRQFATFEALLSGFLREAETPRLAAFGVAGPVQGRVVRTTNLPWLIEAEVLQQRFGFERCLLLNDLEAMAYGLPALGEDGFCVLQPGEPGGHGNAAIIAAGTGLGEAGLFWDGQRHHPYATEGGHASFSPQDEVEVELLRYLQRRHAHVSWERVVSGMGLLDLHDFLRLHHRAPLPTALADEMRQGDAAAVIAGAALSGRDELCAETMRRFVRLYGAEAGNLALKTMSRGGLYVGGGIAPKILPLLQEGDFIQAFVGKGRMRPLLEGMSVRVILDEQISLLGPALCVVGHGG
jgi:glucokinase